MREGYNKLAFWEAYSRFFFAAEPEQGKISTLADSLFHHLAPQLPHAEQEINVLCLGVGVAGFEYPILSAIERASGRRILATGIDSAEFPLHVSSILLKDLQRIFPSSWDFANYIKELWPSSPPPNACGRFRQLDLDGRGNQPLPNDPPWSGDYPSLWHQQLRSDGLVPKDGFDIITAAFCFHHMHWWRPALCNALRLLRPGGLLLLSQVDGDVSFLDWNQPEHWLLQQRRDGECGLVQRMMDAFWQHPDLRKHWLKRPQAGAVRPLPQIDLIERLPLKRLPGAEDGAYFTHNLMRPSDVVAIMKTRGLSPFRMAMDYLRSADRYHHHLEHISARFSGDDRPLPTINRIRWHSFQAPSTRTLNRSSLFKTFTACTSIPKITSPASEPSAQRWEYELLEASAVAHETFNKKNIDSLAFVDFLRQLILSGTLCNRTPFGVMGQRLVRQENFNTALCFANPLCPSNSMAELLLYMSLRQAHLRNFSNSNVLLKTILPRFNIPVVFSYVRDVCQDKDGGSVTLDFQRYRSFLEMRFRIALPRDFRSALTKTEAFKNALTIVRETIKGGKPQAASRQHYPDKRLASFILPLELFSISDVNKERFRISTEALAHIFRTQYGLEKAHQCLTRSRKACGHFGATEDSLRSETLLDQAFSVEMVETLYWLCLIPQWKETVIFPASYTTPLGDSVCADDSMILFFTEELSASHLRHEYRKVSLMLNQLNMRRLATSGEELGLTEQMTSLSHELSKQTSVLFSHQLRKMSAVFQVGSEPRSINPADPDDWPVAFGNVLVSPEHASRVADWWLCPIPSIFRALRDYLTLWAGSRASINDIAPNVRTLGGLVERAVEMARGARVAVSLKGATSRSISDIQEAEADFESRSGELAKVAIDSALYGVELCCAPEDVEERDKYSQVLVLTIRAVAATVSNALQHTPTSSATIQIRMQGQPGGITLETRNPLLTKKNGEVNPDGSVAVIRSCLRLLDKNTTSPVCRPESASELSTEPNMWVTCFLLPNPAVYRNASVLWIKAP